MTPKEKLLLSVVAAGWLFVGAGAPLAQAQSAPATQITPSNDTGLKPFAVYSSDAGNVNLANGNLSLQIPLLSLPGRNGHNLVLAAQYDSKIWTPSATFVGGTDITYTWKAEQKDYPLGDLGWQFNWPTMHQGPYIYDQSGNPVGHGDYIVTLPDGGKHNLGALSPILDSEDGASLRINSSNPNDILVYQKNGTIIHFPSGILTSANKIEDTDGNYITTNASGIVDALGRQVTLTYTSNRLTGISYKDSNGTTQTVTLNYTLLTLMSTAVGDQYFTPTPPFAQPVQNNCPTCRLHIWVNQPNRNAAYWMLTSINLPSGKSYLFTYNGYGELTKVQFPTGGYVAYKYAAYTHDETYWLNYNMNIGADFREVTERHICRAALNPDPPGGCGGGATPEDVTTFTPIVDSTKPNNASMDVVDPLGYKNHHEFSQVDLTLYTKYYSPRELLHQIYSDTGTVLRTIQTDYTYLDGSFCTGCWIYPLRVTTTLNDSGSPPLVSKMEYTYDTYTATVLYPPYNPDAGIDYSNQSPTSRTRDVDNPVQVLEYAYGSGAPGPLLRKKTATWLHVQGGTDYVGSYHIMDRKTNDQVQDPSANKLAETQYEYDSFTEGITSSGAVQHDSSYGTGYTYRGKLTAIKRWRNTDGAYLTTRFQYDDAGNGRKAVDPLTHATTMSYADSWGNNACAPGSGNAAAYLTSVTDALNHITSATYNSCSGTMASLTDVNSQVTTYGYDLLNRYTLTNLPDGGQTTICYTDMGGTGCTQGSPPFKAVTTKKIDSMQSLISTAMVDGLGRVTQTQLNSDPKGVVYTATTYDGLGRTSSVYNPTRCNPPTTNCGESMWGYTTTRYDALNRVTKLIPPDGNEGTGVNIVSTSYVGNCATVTDQAGKIRKSCMDVLGRLIQVFEPNSAGSLVNESDYQYDVLDNLTRVDQKGNDPNSANWRTRTFAYDSLSRLTSATNPESGTIQYTYDTDGNLLTKTAPAPNQAGSATVTTTYSYDALHRLTGKTYSDSTPAVTLTYDAATTDGLTIQSPVGRLVKATTSTTRTVNSYDAMGRIRDQWQCSPTNCGAGWYTAHYNYDLAGDNTSASNPMGFTLTQQFDTAARISQITSSWNDAQHPTTLMTVDPTVGYYPHGALRKMSLGNGLTETAAFNNRLQPCRIDVNSSSVYYAQCTDAVPSGNILDFSYGYNAGTSNNGNVASWSATGAQTFSRTYTYDELNRLNTMTGAGGSCTGLSWNYDPWANRKDQNVTGGSCLQDHRIITPQNRISNISYDAAGNVTSDPAMVATYQYDAENRLVSSNSTLGSATYVYDANGRRIRKTVGSTVTDYFYDLAGNAIAERVGTAWAKGYVYMGSRLLAQYDNTVSPATTYFAHKDHLGSTRLLTKVNTSTQECEDYYPYGELDTSTCSPSTPTTSTTHKFTGKERDSESGLDNYDVRYFGSSLGRFVSPDPLGPGQHPGNPQTWNLYSYVLDNPLSLVDPSGQFTCDAKTVSNQQCDDFQTALDKAQIAADALGEKNGWDSKQYLDAQRAIDAYGDEGVDNGVVIAQGNVGSGQGATAVAGNTVAKTVYNRNGQNIRVTFDKASNVLGADMNSLAALAAHEGVHVADASDWVSSGFSDNANPSLLQTEQDAHWVEASIGEGLGAKSMRVSYGSRNYDFALPLSGVAGPKMWIMIRLEYPKYNLDAFSRNTKITRPQQ